MKITRRQLNSIIIEELQINEIELTDRGVEALGTAVPAIRIADLLRDNPQGVGAVGVLPLAAVASMIAQFVLYKKALTGAEEIVWNDPAFAETRALLETMSETIEKLPDAAKKGAEDFIVTIVNNALDTLKLDGNKDDDVDTDWSGDTDTGEEADADSDADSIEVDLDEPDNEAGV